LLSSQSNSNGSHTQPYLMTSASPAESSRSGSVDVRDDAFGLIERADQILAARMIDAGLAADRGVDLREQRGRNLHVADAALIAGGRKACDIADHAPAQGEHGGVAVHFLRHQRIEYQARGMQRLVLLAFRQDAFGDPARVEPGRQFRKVQAADRGIGHDQQIVAANAARQQLAIAKQARSDRDRIAGMTDINLESVHGVDYTNL